MSRIGKKTISAPSGVKVGVAPGEVVVENGDKRMSFGLHPQINVAFDEGARTVSVNLENAETADRQARAMWGTTRAMIQNMITGVTTGFQKKLEVVGVGYNATVKGRNLELKVGYANVVEVPIPDGLEVTVENNSNITVTGVDKQKVGQLAAVIRAVRKPEPYNGKGIKYSDEVVRRKQGKVFGS
jgi:large subunit ribosomal protein L6